MADSPRFEENIKPMFRELDRSRMEWAFDLWDHESVKDNAPQILQRLEDGDMPCDEPWEGSQIETFRSWMQLGMPP
jgi:hypothetical protein